MTDEIRIHRLKLDEAAEDKLRAMRSLYLVPYEVSVQGAASLKHPYSQIAGAFESNLNTAITVLAVPFAMAAASVQQAAYQRFSISEAIRARGDYPEGGSDLPEARQAVMERASRRYSEWLGSEEGETQVVEGTSEHLLELHQNQDLGAAAAQLLLHGISSLWTAFEVLARDLFEARLNEHPEELRKILDHPEAKRRFEKMPRLSLLDMVEGDFDIRSQLGKYLIEHQDLSDFNSVKAVFEALFPGFNLFNDREASKRLLVLNCQRHLIVHRGGRIDERFRRTTGITAPIGEELRVTPEEFDAALSVCLEVGSRIINCASS